MFKRLLGIASNANRSTADSLYGQIVAAARQPVFYSGWQVPDTPLGRFEMLSLFMFLVLRRLRGETAPAGDIAQELVDGFFREVEHSIRELGIGDMGVPKRIKRLSRMFYGRVEAYDAAIQAADGTALAAALKRNVRPDAETWPEVARLAAYVIEAATSLASQPTDRMLAGSIEFPVPDAVHPGEAA